MPVFNIGETLTTEEPTVDAEELPVGDHVFDLVVEDDRGLRSDPATVRVSVRSTRPTARLSGPPDAVELGNNATLDGRESSAVEPAALRTFDWTLVSSEEPGPDVP